MASTVTLTLTNELGKGATPDAQFTLIPANVKMLLTAGKVITEPAEVPNQTAPTPNNAGIYQTTATPPQIRGIANYNLPDGENKLVVFFTSGTARLLIEPQSLVPDDKLVKKAETSGTKKVDGTLVKDNTVFNYQIIVNHTLSEDGNTLNCSLTASNTY